MKIFLSSISLFWVISSCSINQKNTISLNDNLDKTEWILVSIDSSGTIFNFDKQPCIKFVYDRIVNFKKEDQLIRGRIIITDDSVNSQYYYRIQNAYYFLSAQNNNFIETWWQDYRLTDKYETVLRLDNPRLYEILYHALNGKGNYEINGMELKINIKESKNIPVNYILNLKRK